MFCFCLEDGAKSSWIAVFLSLSFLLGTLYFASCFSLLLLPLAPSVWCCVRTPGAWCFRYGDGEGV